jgi:hypothetical protein
MTQVFKLHALFYLYSFDYKLKEAMDLPHLAVAILRDLVLKESCAQVL